MTDIQNYLQDLLSIDCELQTNLHHLLLVTSREALEAKSNDIKRGLKDYKEKLNEMKDFCDSFSTNINNSLLDKVARVASSKNDQRNQSTMSSSPKDIFINEYNIQREHLTTIESRFRNTYLAAQVKLDQIERDLLTNSRKSSDSGMEAKRRNINNQMLLKQSNEMTTKLNDLNKQLNWTVNQTSDIIPVLDESSKVIKNTQQELGQMKVVITDGKRLLIRLGRREFTDKLLIIICLLFFFSVVFYIVWKRFF